jgi:aminoglycoside phosphotransferase (APT) family kinase protein
VADSNDLPGVDPERVTAWFQDHADQVSPPLAFDLIAGGHSNLTYRVTDTAGRRWVLRRPPTGQVLATAHDMEREHRIISALAPTDVPVAPTIGLCTDLAVNDAPFYVMDFVDGLVVRSEESGHQLTPEARRRAGESLVDTMVRMHAVDVDAVGLGELGRREGYLSRHLKRWYGQWNQSKTRELPAVDQVHDHLVADLPEQHGATIVHGDYRLDNVMFARDLRQVAAVVDWELSTLGDPLADLGLMLTYVEVSDQVLGGTTAEGLLDARATLDAYAARTDLDLSRITWYVAFGVFKLAVILEGVHARYLAGATVGEGFATMGAHVPVLAERAAALLEV